MSESCLKELARAEDDLHATLRHEMIAVGTDPEPALDGVAENAARRTGTGRIQREPDASVTKVFEQLGLGDTGLDHGVREVGVDLADPVHATEIEDYIVVARWKRGPVTPIVTSADGIKGTAMRVRNPDDLLDLRDRFGPQHGGDAAPDRNGAPSVTLNRLFVRERMLLTHDASELENCRVAHGQVADRPRV